MSDNAVTGADSSQRLGEARLGSISINGFDFVGPTTDGNSLPPGPGVIAILDVGDDGAWRLIDAHHAPRLSCYAASPRWPEWRSKAAGRVAFAFRPTEKWLDPLGMRIMFMLWAIRDGRQPSDDIDAMLRLLGLREPGAMS